MTSVAISPKFQVVIPKVVREALKLRPGQRLDVRLDEVSGAVVLEPQLDIRAARGFLKPVPGEDLTHIVNDPEGPTWPGGCDPVPDADWVRPASAAGSLGS